DREVVALGVRGLVDGPDPDRGLALGLDPAVGAVAELHDQTSLGPDLEMRRARAGLAVRDDFAEALPLGADFGLVGAIGSSDRNQPLAIQAEAVIGIVR